MLLKHGSKWMSKKDQDLVGLIQLSDEFHQDLKHSGPGVLLWQMLVLEQWLSIFITHVTTNWLDNKRTVFGNVIEGMTS